MWKNEKFTLTEEKFRQINYLVLSLLKQLLSRVFFWQKCVKVNSRNFHTEKFRENSIECGSMLCFDLTEILQKKKKRNKEMVRANVRFFSTVKTNY